MAFLDQEFNVDELPESNTGSYDPLPEGWYNVSIAGAELKNTKAGNGQYIAVRYDVTGPTHQGRVVFGNLNIKNPNSVAEEIGRKQLGELMRAIGLAKVSDTDQLIGGSLSVKLSIRKSEEYGDSNEVKAFKALSGSVPVPSNSGEKAPQAPAKNKPAWAK